MGPPPNLDLFMIGAALMGASAIPMAAMSRLPSSAGRAGVPIDHGPLVEIAGIVAPLTAFVGAGCWLICFIEYEQMKQN